MIIVFSLKFYILPNAWCTKYIYKRDLWNSFMSMFHFLLRRRPCLFFLNLIETLPVECSMYPAECNICLVKCSIYPVESSIDFGHLKFPLGLILTTILTPKVENEVLSKMRKKMKCWQRLMENKVLAETYQNNGNNR